ncbi:MAG: deoxyribodipyrimidine photolyase [Desulfomonilaceae bacterium]
MDHTPKNRIAPCNRKSIDPGGEYVVYWMTAYRRTSWNFSLQRAVEWAETLKKPLVILEALRADYKWASDRLHRFVIEGMRDNWLRLKNSKALYYPYIEMQVNAGKGLLSELAHRACVVVADDFPCFFLPRMLSAAALQVPVLLEKVDANGLLPMQEADQAFLRAFDFRRFLQKRILPHLFTPPEPDPVASLSMRAYPDMLSYLHERWQPAYRFLDDVVSLDLSRLPIDHSVPPAETAGGCERATATLRTFLRHSLSEYDVLRNHPDDDATSGLSPYLHFGQISVHQIFQEVAQHEGWSPDRLAPQTAGKRSGWWGMSAGAEAFLDELVTWRELGYNMCRFRKDYDAFESLPEWAKETLEKHTLDTRPYLYSLQQLENAETHDELWNAAQNQLRREGKIHNYLRMLWGKNILAWTPSPREALHVMIHLNNKYALDGRNPNSYTGILWCLGRYDRPWGPERPIFGKVRYMSSQSTKQKVRVSTFIRKYAR